MISKTVTSAAFAAACLLGVGMMPAAQAQYYTQETITNGPQASRGDFGDWSARRNVIESRHYEQLLQNNGRFRQARMHKECGPIQDAQLRSECMASFGHGEPYVGSTMPPRRDRFNPNAGY